MISFETYQKIRELYEIGVSQNRIAKKLGITQKTVSRWVTADESEFYELKNTRFFISTSTRNSCSNRSAPARR